MKRAILYILMMVSLVYGNDKENVFPIPLGKELRIHFWVSVFTHYSVLHRIIHDEDAPERIYRVIDLGSIDPEWRVSGEILEAMVDAEVERFVLILKKLGDESTDYDRLSTEERRIVKMFGSPPDRRVFKRASHRVHVQEGIRERFAASIRRSQQYLDDIRSIFEEEGLPLEIAYLPHVESSFHPDARSKDGAVGLWQFTRGTGIQYLRIRGDVDERRDPILSTQAAARHLKTNYRVLGNWPLALTAYNYGLNGMRRIVRRWGTRDLGTIIDKHSSRRFGYASKNFYLEFLAAVRVAENPDAYFEDDDNPLLPRLKKFVIPPPFEPSMVPVPQPVCDSVGNDDPVIHESRDENTGLPCRVM